MNEASLANAASASSPNGFAELIDDAPPKARLAALVQATLNRSQSYGAVTLLADAARNEVAEAQAGKDPQISANGGVGPSLSRSGGTSQTAFVQMQAGVQVSQVFWDGGRLNHVIDWRAQLAEAARQGRLNLEEQLAATAVSLALERSRFRQQVLVYGQYVRKMACLVQGLEEIVAADRGRASELVQARKSLQQAELSRQQSQSQLRQVEARLRKLAGDGLPSSDGLSSVLLAVPALEEMQAAIPNAPEIAQLNAQALAADRLAQSIEATSKPHVSWVVGGNTNLGIGGTGGSRGGALSAGINISIPLTPTVNIQAAEAARKRAQAALMQREEALETRRARLGETYEQTLAAMDRARRVGAVLRDSEQLRNFTLQQWQQLGRRSLFDVMSTEGEHYNLRVQYLNALHDQQQLNALLWSLGRGVGVWVR